MWASAICSRTSVGAPHARRVGTRRVASSKRLSSVASLQRGELLCSSRSGACPNVDVAIYRAAIAISGLVCFAAIRLVSLHQVDTLLYRRDFGGVHIVAIVETIGIALVVLSTLWNPFFGHTQSPGSLVFRGP